MNIKVGSITIPDQVGDEHEIPAIELVLSERNLRAMLATIGEENNAISRWTETGIMMLIRSESDEIHYAERPAGLMSEDLELQLAAEELANDEVLYVPEDL